MLLRSTLKECHIQARGFNPGNNMPHKRQDVFRPGGAGQGSLPLHTLCGSLAATPCCCVLYNAIYFPLRQTKYENLCKFRWKKIEISDTFPTGNGKHNYEIDFLLPDGDKITPIEVKSSGYKVHASLDAFFDKFHARVKQQYIIYTKDLRKDNSVTYLPVYMTGLLWRPSYLPVFHPPVCM